MGALYAEAFPMLGGWKILGGGHQNPLPTMEVLLRIIHITLRFVQRKPLNRQTSLRKNEEGNNKPTISTYLLPSRLLRVKINTDLN